MMKRIEDYQVGDSVDVWPGKNDIFFEFTGTITDIDSINDTVVVRDQDDDYYTVHINQISLTYNTDEDTFIA